MYIYFNNIFISSNFAGLEWFNVSRPLTLAGDLKGRVTVLDFFTYCCINCMHILPDLEALEKRHPAEDGEVLVVGVHSAKFENERVSANILAAIERYHIHHPVVNDPEGKMWLNLGISCWPTLLILGPNGHPLFVLVGEGHCERLQLYVKVAIKYFSGSGILTKSVVPLAPSRHFKATGSVLLFPGKVTVHPGGIIVSDSGHNRILLTDHDGNVMKIIGSGEQGFRDGSFGSASFSNPQGVVYHHPDAIYVADTGNHAIRKVDVLAETVKTIAGTGTQGKDFEGGLHGTYQAISSPWDVCLARSLDQAEDGMENLLLVAMAGCHQIWGVFLSDGKWLKGSSYSKGTVIRLAGSGAEENRNTSYPHRAGFAQPSGLALGTCFGVSVLLIADAESSSIRKMNLTDGAVKSAVGGARDPLDLFAYGDTDGCGVDAKLQHPLAVATVGESVYVADSYNHKIKVAHPSGKAYKISTVIGGECTEKAEGDVRDSKLSEPGGLCASLDGSCLYIADTNNHSIKILSLTDYSMKELPIKLVDESDSPSQDLLLSPNENEEVTALIPHGREIRIILRFRCDLPEDAVLNDEAPNRWTLETSDSRVALTASQGQLQRETDVPVTLHLDSHDASEALLTLSCVLFMCLKSGLCITKTSKCNVKLKCMKSGELAEEEEIIVNIKINV
ncbi:NHL repeat-containing protein 2 [Panulirus ornatus]|uniref:NHL repeat-containing protein 2 n=1 Tax=Panulirus ornatus TaxID=150431 RepID=UPI003A8BD1B7